MAVGVKAGVAVVIESAGKVVLTPFSSLTDKYIDQIDGLTEAKESELLET